MEAGEETYVYGVTRSGEDVPLPAEGVAGRPVERVDRGQLSAIVSTGLEPPVRANRRNLMAHTTVLQGVAAERAVLPMRFGVVMPGRDAVAEELLGEHEAALEAQLEAFANVVELDLKVVCPEEVLLRAIVSERPDLAATREKLRDQPPDATYFERLRLGEAIAAAVEETRQGLLQRVVGQLEPMAVSTEVSEPAHEQMLVNVAFLVERSRVARFDHAVAMLAEDIGPDVRCKYVGPLPPFHFMETAGQQGGVAWA